MSFFISPQTCTKRSQTFHVLAQFPFTTSGTELDYRHQKVALPVALQVTERLRIRIL